MAKLGWSQVCRQRGRLAAALGVGRSPLSLRAVTPAHGIRSRKYRGSVLLLGLDADSDRFRWLWELMACVRGVVSSSLHRRRWKGLLET